MTTNETSRIEELIGEWVPDSPTHSCVADQGDYFGGKFEQVTISPTQSSYSTNITVNSSLTTSEQELIEDAVTAVEPQSKTCFANAMQIWNHNPEFAYVEGYAIIEDSEFLFEHAWNLLDGTFVDTTPTYDPFDEFYGVVFNDRDLLSKYVELGQNEDVWGVLGNHRDHHQYLRDNGYF